MHYGVLAIDYDGTIAEHGRLAPGVRDALADTRRAGVTVVVATGRVLGDLQRVAGELTFADAVVAENGAVLHFPASGRTLRLHGPPPPEFVSDLRRRGVVVDEGDCVVEAGADAAHTVLDVIRGLELPLTIAFNRGRLMVLPQAVSKATGLREVLGALRLSSHNTLAIGDAENDHALLASAEVGVAVAWGSAALTRAADLVVPGRGPADVPAYLRACLASPDLPRGAGRRRLVLGFDALGQPLSVAVHDRNVLVAGDPRSGKSWVAGLLTEQLVLARYSVAVVDPEGDYRSLEALPGVTVAADGHEPSPETLGKAFRFADGSLVLDLSHTPAERARAMLGTALPILARLRRTRGLPHRIVVDEAHYFLQTLAPELAEDLGHAGYTFVTYRPSELDERLLRDIGVVIATRLTAPREIAALARWTSVPAESLQAALGSLSVSEAVLLPTAVEAGGALLRFTVAPRLTAHVRHRHKYADLPVARHERFVFTQAPGRPAALSLAGLAAMLEQLAPEALGPHLRAGDFSRWIADIFRDDALAAAIRALEGQYDVGREHETAQAIVHAIRARYDLKGDPAA